MKRLACCTALAAHVLASLDTETCSSGDGDGSQIIDLYRNGASRPATSISISADYERGQLYGRLLESAHSLDSRLTVLFDENGRPLLNGSATDAVRVYALRPGEMWIWPARNRTVDIGGNTYALQVLSTSPRVLLVRKLLNVSECADLSASADGRYQLSAETRNPTAAFPFAVVQRSSRRPETAWSGMRWGKQDRAVRSSKEVVALQTRAVDALRVSLSHAEPFEVMRYSRGGALPHHIDATQDPATQRQDWTLNFDGTRDASGRAVKGAVDDFFAGVSPAPFESPMAACPRQLSVTYREGSWNSWVVVK